MSYLHVISNLTFDHSEQKTQVECLSSSGRNGIHAPNNLVSLMDCPHSTLLVPHKSLGKVLVEMVMCSSSDQIRVLICLEPSKQLSILDIIDHIWQMGLSTKDNILLSWQMD